MKRKMVRTMKRSTPLTPADWQEIERRIIATRPQRHMLVTSLDQRWYAIQYELATDTWELTTPKDATLFAAGHELSQAVQRLLDKGVRTAFCRVNKNGIAVSSLSTRMRKVSDEKSQVKVRRAPRKRVAATRKRRGAR